MSKPSFTSTEVIKSAEKVWGTSLQPAGCIKCKQAYLVTAENMGKLCPLCAGSLLESQPARIRSEPPESIIPFRIKPGDLKNIFSGFVKGIWFKPGDFNPLSMMERIQPVYWPRWMVDSDMAGIWQAEAGFDYEVKSSRESYSGGGWQTNEIVETRVKWEPRTGQLFRHYDNVVTPALTCEDRLINIIGDYNTGDFFPYSPEHIEKTVLHIPDLIPESAWPLAETGFKQWAANECAIASGAQHIRNFTIQADYENLNWTQLLFPMYFTYYKDDSGKAHPVYINGQTGNIGGIRLSSQKKGWIWGGIFGVATLILFIITLLLGLLGIAFLPVLLIAAFTCFSGFVTGILAVVFVIWPWRLNRQQKTFQAVAK